MTQQAVDLQIGGMTCASCAARIEKKLNRMPGVQASVNYATEKAHVLLPAGTDVEATIATVEATGYTARLPEPPARAGQPRRRNVRRRRRGGVAATPAGDLRAADPPGVRAGDGRAAAVRQLAVAVADPGRAGGGVGRVAVPPGRLGQRPARRGHDGHADQPRRARRVRLVAVRVVLRRRRRHRHDDDVHPDPATRVGGRRDLPRGGRGGHRVHPRRALLRGPRQEALRRGAARAAGPGRQGRRGAAGRPRGPDPGRPAGRRRPVRGPAGREDRHRRGGRGGIVRGRRQPAHRRVGAGRGRPGRRGHRRDGQRRRSAAGARHPGRRGHPAGPDGRAGGAGADRQGPGAAAGRSGVGGLRARS